MSDNLAYLPFVFPLDSLFTEDRYYVYEYNGTNISEAKNTLYYNKYGALYNWKSAKTACPSGWHLPSDDEWLQFKEFLGSNHWEERLENVTGWNKEYEVINKSATYWTSTE